MNPSSEQKTNNTPNPWSWSENKAFENGLAIFSENTEEGLWEKLATLVPGRSLAEVKEHYKALVDDVAAIEAGDVELPAYLDDFTSAENNVSTDVVKAPSINSKNRNKKKNNKKNA